MSTLTERINNDLEEIDKIDNLDTTECQSDGDWTARNSTETDSSCISTDGITAGNPIPNCNATEEFFTTSQTNRANKKGHRVKSLSYNGATLQKLQLKRMELRTLPLISPSGNADSFFRTPVSQVAADRKELATTLPLVGDATKEKLLQLNQRYAPSTSHYANLSYSHPLQMSTRGVETKNSSSQPSPFKLIEHEIGSNDTKCAANLITPESKHLRHTDRDVGAESDHYLFQFTHLACGSIAKCQDSIVDDEASCSLSYDSPTPHQHAELICSSGVDEDITCNDKRQPHFDNNNSCKSWNRHVTLLQNNRRLRKFVFFMKHAMIILGIALFFACLDVAKDKIMHWLRIIMQRIFSLAAGWAESSVSSASAWLQSAQGKIITFHQHSMCWMMSSVYEWKELVQNRFMQQIAVWKEFSFLGKYHIDYTQLILPRQATFLGRTKQLKEVFVRGFGSVNSNLHQDIDFTSILIDAWFRIGKFQLDCQLFVRGATQGIKELKDIVMTIWNSTAVFVSSELYAFMYDVPPPTNNRGLIILEKSTITNPNAVLLGNPIPLLDIWHNQTLSLGIPKENRVIRSKSIIAKPLFLLRAPQYLHRASHSKCVGSLSNDCLTEHIEHKQIHTGYLSSTMKSHSHTKLSPEEQARQHYEASYPTLSTNTEDDEDSSFESVNLMDMATELTKRLISRRRHN